MYEVKHNSESGKNAGRDQLKKYLKWLNDPGNDLNNMPGIAEKGPMLEGEHSVELPDGSKLIIQTPEPGLVLYHRDQGKPKEPPAIPIVGKGDWSKYREMSRSKDSRVYTRKDFELVATVGIGLGIGAVALAGGGGGGVGWNITHDDQIKI